MSIEHNKETVRRYIEEVLSNFDYTNIEELVHEDFTAYPGGNELNRNNHYEYFSKMRERTPNMRNNIDYMVAEGDKVVAFSAWSDNIPEEALKEMTEIPPNIGKVAAVYTMKDGKIFSGIVYGNRH